MRSRRYISNEADQEEDNFGWHSDELKRRKRNADYKRRQHGASFVDHTVVTVRGGEHEDDFAVLVELKLAFTMQELEVPEQLHSCI